MHQTKWQCDYVSKTAVGTLNEDRSFTVEAGSDFANHMVSSLTEGRQILRENLINGGYLKQIEDGHYIFMVNYTFSSLSEAISVIRGFQGSGPKYWSMVS